MTRNRLPALVAGLTALTMAPGLITLGSAPAQAAPPPVPTAVTATTSVDTVAARVLGVTLPLPLGSLSAADIELGDVDGAVAGTDPRSSAHAANLDAAAVGLPLGGILSAADQDAPPDNPAPVTATTIPTIDAAPLVTAGVSNSSAHARFSSDATCLPPGTPLSTSTTSTTDIEAVALPGVGSLLALPGEVTTTQSISLASTGGARDARRVTARTSSTIASADLFGSLDVGVSAPPQITATATGTSPASVTYNQPVVTVSGPGLPQDVVLDAANETAAFTLPENPLLGLELSLGALTRTEAADGTRASGSAALLHVRLFLVNALTPDPSDGVDVALLDLVPMEATATAPLGGITCADPSDTTPPGVVVITDPTDGTTTPDATPDISGTGGEAGSTITVRDTDGTIVCTDTTVGPEGAWSCTPTSPLSEGDHELTATATDTAGNTSGPSDPVTVTVDATDPAVSLEQPADGTSTNDSTPTASGTAEPGASIEVTDEDGTTVCTTTASPQGTWSCTGSTPLAAGDHTFTATATDETGNTATDTSTFTVDPAAPDVDITNPAQGSSTNDSTPTASGTAEPGSTVVVTRDGSVPVCIAVATDGTWSCTSVVPLDDGPHTYTATATDANGNSGSDATTFSVDTQAPGDPVITSPADGSQVADTTPSVTGRGEPASVVTVREGPTVICSATVGADGRWSCTPETPLGAGSHTFIATAVDASGNVSGPASTTFTITAVTGNPDNNSDTDTDGDGISDADEVDTDGNGPDTGTGTDPTKDDTDGDGLSDDEEVDIDRNGPDTGTGTDPLKADTDRDGLSDGTEVKTTKTDPLAPDTDADRLEDGAEVNGMTIKERFEICGQKKTRKSIRVTTNPLVKDTDKDGLTDGREVKGYVINQRVTFTRSGQTFKIGKTRSNPTKADTDKDGLRDKVEKNGSANKRWSRRKTDPTKCDTDQGGARDGREVRAGSDPSRIKSGPNDLMRRTGRSSIG